MATILVVDDRPVNREFFATLLGYKGHRVLEAGDGAEALELVRADRPHLVISDILMPTMDGYEFVRRLRAEPDTADIPVVFSTAHYLDREARSLAEACGVMYTITKPAEPEAVLRTVDAALGIVPSPAPSPPEEFDREHLRLLTDKLAEKTRELTRVNERLTAVIDLGQQLAAERDPLYLLEGFCHSARRIVGAKYCAILVLGNDDTVEHFFSSGMDAETASRIGPPPIGLGLFGKLLREGGSLRVRDISEDRRSAGMPSNHPPMSSFLGSAIASSSGIYGALYLTDKIGFDEFSQDDEKLIGMLVAQVGIGYENARRFEELQRRAAELQETVVQRQRAEHELVVTPRRLQHTLASSPAAIYTLSVDGDDYAPLWVSENIAWILGYTVDEALDPNWWSRRVHPNDLESASEDHPELLRNNRLVRDYRFMHKDGTYRWVRDEQRLLRDAHDEPSEIVGAWVDITDSKKAEEELSEANQTLQSLIQTSPLAIIAYDLEGNVRNWNSAAERIFGWTSTEVIGERNPIVPEDKWEEFLDSLEITHHSGMFTNLETTRSRKDGSQIDVSLSSAPLVDGKGKIHGSVTVIADITDRKGLEEQLRQSQKMEAIGRLAGGVAHDFNNLLTAIIGYSQLGLGRLGAEDPMRKELEEIERAGQRAAALTGQLLAFSRRQVLQPKVLDLNVVVADLGKMLNRLIGEDIELKMRLSPNLGSVKADRGQIDQILMNLAVNSRDAMPAGGKLTIETANVELDESYVSDHVDSHSGSHVMLAISDNGGGMDKQTLSRIFEPFFTTKEQGKGTGLGLSTVFGIVKQSGGHIGVYSEPGVGTTFKVYLPRTEDLADFKDRRVVASASVRGTESILLVEDEASVRKLARTILQNNGYTVLEAACGEEAREMSEKYEGLIHLMLTDVIMPGTSGRELAQIVADLRPEMKVLYMSGYTDDAIVHHGILDAETPFIQKPFTPDSLLRKVHGVLRT